MPTNCGIGHCFSIVMPGLVPGIHVLWPCNSKDVDGRDEPGHDKSKDVGSRDIGVRKHAVL
jgi:hypothetical protein